MDNGTLRTEAEASVLFLLPFRKGGQSDGKKRQRNGMAGSCGLINR